MRVSIVMRKTMRKDNLTSRRKRAAETDDAGAGRSERPTRRHRGDAERSVVVPVVAEEVRVGKRTVETGRLRVTKVVQEREEVIDQPLLKTSVVVERVPINQYVAKAPAVREEEDTLVIPMIEEVIVVEKRLMLREELRIRRQQVNTRHPQTVTVRREEVRVDRLKAGEDAAVGNGTTVANPSHSGQGE